MDKEKIHISLGKGGFYAKTKAIFHIYARYHPTPGNLKGPLIFSFSHLPCRYSNFHYSFCIGTYIKRVAFLEVLESDTLMLMKIWDMAGLAFFVWIRAI